MSKEVLRARWGVVLLFWINGVAWSSILPRFPEIKAALEASNTAFGLAVAVPTHLAHHFLRGRVRVLVHDMEWAANEIIRFVLHDLRTGADGAGEAAAAPAAKEKTGP